MERGRWLPFVAMRGTDVGSFIFGSFLPHNPPVPIFIQLFSKNASVFLVGVTMEGNKGNAPPEPCNSPANSDLPLTSCFACPPIPPPNAPALFPQRCPAVKRLRDPVVCNVGWRHCIERMPWVCGQRRHGEKKGGQGGCILASDTLVFSLFFPLLPVVLWPTYQ